MKRAPYTPYLPWGATVLTNLPDHAGVTPFTLAVGEENLSLVRALVEEGQADMDVTNISGRGIWDVAFSLKHPGILHYLVSVHKARLGSETLEGTPVPTTPLSPLHVAAQMDSVAMVTRLLEMGVDVRERDSQRMNTFLHIAAAESKLGILDHPWSNYDNILHARNRNRLEIPYLNIIGE